MNAFFAALGRGVVRFRYLVVVIWILGTVVATASLPSLGSEVNNNNSAFLPNSAPSNQAADLAKPLLGSSSNSEVPVIAATTGSSLTAADQAAIARAKTQLAQVPTVISVTFLGQSADSRAVQLLVVSSVSNFDQSGGTTLINRLQSALAQSGFPSDLKVHLAGALATDVANQKQSQKQGNLVQSLSILFILVLLLLIFRALLAPFITLIPAVIVLLLSSALIGALGSAGLQISSVTQVLLIVLILGAGTDYGLFLVFRVREEIYRGRDPKDAVAVAVLRVGESISASAGTVIVALLSLFFATFGIYHDLGAPLAIGIAVMLLAGLTLVPALLAIFGRAVFWPTKVVKREASQGLWGRAAGRLVRKPALTLVIGVVIFGGLALAVTGFKPGGFGGQLTAPSGSNAALGNASLAAHFPQSSGNPTNVIMKFPTSVWQDPAPLVTATNGLQHTGSFKTLAGPLDPSGTALTPSQLTELHQQLGPPGALPTTPPAGSSVSLSAYNAYRATSRFISANGQIVQWEAGLTAGDPSSTSALHAVPTIRTQVTQVAHEAGATASGIAGEAPGLYDVSTVSDGDLRHIVPIAVLAIGIVLALVLRSLVAPLYLIASVVLSYLASLGLAVIAFITIGGQGGITFLLPFLMFIFLLALGEDYNILVMSRIREEAAHRPLREAVVTAVGATGPTVTSAGLVLAGTFAVLAIVGGSGSGGSQLQEIGFGLAVGILLDTFVVRTVLVPSTVALLGRWNWWPSSMGRRHPDEPTDAAPTVGSPDEVGDPATVAPSAR